MPARWYFKFGAPYTQGCFRVSLGFLRVSLGFLRVCSQGFSSGFFGIKTLRRVRDARALVLQVRCDLFMVMLGFFRDFFCFLGAESLRRVRDARALVLQVRCAVCLIPRGCFRVSLGFLRVCSQGFSSGFFGIKTLRRVRDARTLVLQVRCAFLSSLYRLFLDLFWFSRIVLRVFCLPFLTFFFSLRRAPGRPFRTAGRQDEHLGPPPFARLF